MFKPQQWEPATWVPSGTIVDSFNYLCDYVNQMSDGRLVLTPTAAGATTPVDQALDFVASGGAEAMSIAPSYFAGKVPVFFLWNDAVGVPKSIAEIRNLYETWEGGRISQIADEELAKYGDVARISNLYYDQDGVIVSNVPLPDINSVKGKKWRCAGIVAPVAKALGAGTVWFPGTEIYTSLATGVVDIATYDTAVTMVSMGLHEVSKYWLTKPLVAYKGSDMFIVNGTVWKELPDDLKAILRAASEASYARGTYAFQLDTGKAWKTVEAAGIQISAWSDADVLKYGETIKSAIMAEYYGKDASSTEYLDVVTRWAQEMGYWE